MTPTRHDRRAHSTRRLTAGSAAIAVALGLVLSAGASSAAAATAEAQETTVLTLAADAQTAYRDAQSALSAALIVRADVTYTALDLGDADVAISTRDAWSSVELLKDAASLAPVVVEDRIANARAATTAIERRTAEVQKVLDEALAAKKAADAAAAAAKAAAEKARKEAEEAAARAAAEAAEAAAAASARTAAPGTSAGEAQAIAARLASERYGWGADQFSCLVSLWNKESGWNSQAYNASSGATGIPQALPGSKMASAGADWQTNATTQIIWGLGYIDGRYGSPCAAWGHSQATGWY
jgi:hypothetical protein